MRLVDATALVADVLKERDKIPLVLPAAIYELRKEKPSIRGELMRGGIRKALHCIENAPTIDAAPVVRCKDCEYNYETITHLYLCRSPGVCADCIVSPNFYCAEGKRKEPDE